ncbi:hypothetical protein, partial [Roseibium sediminis]|uniref:WD40 repeat domain-containing protein n=1 Tax=Roseibium sediminis TaxID=1775174 RepID=UPI00195EE977
LWSVETGNLVKSFEGHEGYVWSAVFSKDETLVLTASDDNTAKLWILAPSYKYKSGRWIVGHSHPLSSENYTSLWKKTKTGISEESCKQLYRQVDCSFLASSSLKED